MACDTTGYGAVERRGSPVDLLRRAALIVERHALDPSRWSAVSPFDRCSALPATLPPRSQTATLSAGCVLSTVPFLNTAIPLSLGLWGTARQLNEQCDFRGPRSQVQPVGFPLLAPIRNKNLCSAPSPFDSLLKLRFQSTLQD